MVVQQADALPMALAFPFESWSQVLHFQSNSLLMTWKGRKRWPIFLGPYSNMGDLGEASGSWLLINSLWSLRQFGN